MLKYRFISVFIILTVFISLFSSGIDVNAASGFTYKDITNNKKVTYRDRTPLYYVDGVLVDNSDYPAIISDGYALAPTMIFTAGCNVGYTFDKSLGELTFIYNDNILVLYLGSTDAYLNGEFVSAPKQSIRIRYSATNEYENLVPSRFVAESLGMDYTWHQDTSSIDIVTPVPLIINNEYVYYSGTLGNIEYNGKEVKNAKAPSYIFDDNAVLAIKNVANAIEGLEFDYNQYDGSITISYGNVLVEMTLNDTAAYVNGLCSTAPVAPQYIYNTRTETGRIYVPGRFVFENLGFNYEWSNSTSKITLTENSGIYMPDYDFALFYNPEHEPTRDENNKLILKQTLDFPILEGIKTELITIHEYIYDNLVSFDLAGNFIDFYMDHPPVNSGEALNQIQILYYEAEDITRINFYTRSDESQIILGYKTTYSSDNITFTFDRPGNLFDKIIVLDAGHGGTDPGTVHNGYNEKDVNFSIVYTYCKELFDSSNIKVYYSRYDDTLVNLHARPALSARVEADFFVSVHHNSASNKSAKGTQVYYSVKNKGNFNGMTSLEMSKLFYNNLVDALGTKASGIGGARNYVVVSEENSVPSVILEIGFMSNADDLAQIIKPKFQKKVAKAIYNTVKEIYKLYGD